MKDGSVALSLAKSFTKQVGPKTAACTPNSFSFVTYIAVFGACLACAACTQQVDGVLCQVFSRFSGAETMQVRRGICSGLLA